MARKKGQETRGRKKKRDGGPGSPRGEEHNTGSGLQTMFSAGLFLIRGKGGIQKSGRGIHREGVRRPKWLQSNPIPGHIIPE